MAVQVSDNFYVLLPSNEAASKVYYPDNATDEFTVKLANHVILPGKYRVGVASVILPRRWANVTEVNGSFQLRKWVTDPRGERVEVMTHNGPTKIKVPAP